MSSRAPGGSLRVVIAGGGVAALEATLALRDLAGDLVEVTLVAPTDRFTFAPASVGAPFGKSVVRQFDLFRIANDLGVRLVIGAVAAVGAGSQARDPCGRQRACLPRALDRLWRDRARGDTGRSHVSRAGGCRLHADTAGRGCGRERRAAAVRDAGQPGLDIAAVRALPAHRALSGRARLRPHVRQRQPATYAAPDRPGHAGGGPARGVRKRGQRRRGCDARRTGDRVPSGPDARALRRRPARDAARRRPAGRSGAGHATTRRHADHGHHGRLRRLHPHRSQAVGWTT